MKTPQSVYQDLLATNEALVSSQMFGKPCGKYKGKAIITFYQEEIAFKLGRAIVPNLLKKHKGSKPFDPSGKGRPFKDWIQMPLDHQSIFDDMLQEAIELFDNS